RRAGRGRRRDRPGPAHPGAGVAPRRLPDDLRTSMIDDIDALTLEEKASLLSGHDDWYTETIDRLGIPAIEVGDGPHGLRKETGVDMVWVPATGFPTASALGASWDREL